MTASRSIAYGLPAVAEDIASAEVNVLPCHRRCRRREGHHLLVPGSLGLGQQPRQDRRVVEPDRVGDPPRTLVADLDLQVGPAGEFLFAADPARSPSATGDMTGCGSAS